MPDFLMKFRHLFVSHSDQDILIAICYLRVALILPRQATKLLCLFYGLRYALHGYAVACVPHARMLLSKLLRHYSIMAGNLSRVTSETHDGEILLIAPARFD